MSSTKPVRKFPPPCWTRDEALVLIEAYRVRWHALNRAFLRNPDWDAVAETVTTSCPDVTPPKTAAQCRHKMEKLRQRHRTEKQRAATFPGERFFSTWFYYEAMEAMENGTKYEPGANQGSDPGQGIRVKPLAVQNFPTLPPNSTRQRTKPNPNPNPNSNSASIRYNSFNNNGLYNVDGFGQRSIAEPPIKNPKRSSIGSGVRTSITGHESGRPGLRPRKFSKVVNDNDDDDEDEMWMKVPRTTTTTTTTKTTNGLRGKWGNGKGSAPNVKKGKKGGDGGIKEVVSSIRLLGEGFMKVETMKMDMVREIEEMRMQTEMRRNELMIESQKQIVEAFVQGLVKSRNVQQQVQSVQTTIGNNM